MKMHVPLPKPQPWVLPVTIVCLFFGGFIAFLMGASTDDPASVDTSQLNREQLAVMYSQLAKENKAQQAELSTLRTTQNELTNGEVTEQKLKTSLQQQIDELRVFAGSTPVKGPGILITLDDTGLKNSAMDSSTELHMVHDVDLLTLVNELRSAGAEAICVNEQRLTGSTAIRCAGPVIQVNNTPIAAPFHIMAVGKPDTLYGAVNMPGGILEYMRQMISHVDVQKRTDLLLPAVKVLSPLEYGKPVLDEKQGAQQQ